MAYEVIILCHLHMPLFFIGTFTEYLYLHDNPLRYKHKMEKILRASHQILDFVQKTSLSARLTMLSRYNLSKNLSYSSSIMRQKPVLRPPTRSILCWS